MEILYVAEHGSGRLGVGIDPQQAPPPGAPPPAEVVDAAATYYGNEPFEWTGTVDQSVGGRHEWQFTFDKTES